MSLLIQMTRPYLEGLPEVKLPEGYRLVSADELEAPEAMWAALVNKSFGNTSWTADYVRENFASKEQFDPRGVFFVLCGTQAVATAFAWLDEPGETRSGRIHWVGTDPDHRRKGLGTAVVVAIMRYFRDRGFTEAFLETHPPLIPAIRVYLSLGLEPTPRNEEEQEAWREVFARIRDQAP